MSFRKDIPYNNLPELPPTGELEAKPVLKMAIKSNSALAELRGVGRQIPNPAILIRAIGLQEARASSEIENIVTTNDELYRALADSSDRVDKATKEVLRYQDALWVGLNALQHRRILSTNIFCEVASTIKQHEMNVRKQPGTKLVNDTGEIIYTPPEGENVIRSKLANLEKFIHEQSDLDPLIKLAIIHYQFEAIHPFTDGNGRTGRIINILYLVVQKLLDIPILYLSKSLIERKENYYARLRGVTENDAWDEWIMFMLEAIEQTAKETTNRIIAIKNVMSETQELVRQRLPKIYSWELIEILFYWPYCKVGFLEERNIAKRQTASSYLHSLEGLGLLQSIKVGREKYFINRRLMNLLRE